MIVDSSSGGLSLFCWPSSLAVFTSSVVLSSSSIGLCSSIFIEKVLLSITNYTVNDKYRRLHLKKDGPEVIILFTCNFSG